MLVAAIGLIALLSPAQAGTHFSNYVNQPSWLLPEVFTSDELELGHDGHNYHGITMRPQNFDAVLESFTVSIYVSEAHYYGTEKSTGLLYALPPGGHRVHIPGNLLGSFSTVTVPNWDGTSGPFLCSGVSTGIDLDALTGYSLVVQRSHRPLRAASLFESPVDPLLWAIHGLRSSSSTLSRSRATAPNLFEQDIFALKA